MLNTTSNRKATSSELTRLIGWPSWDAPKAPTVVGHTMIEDVPPAVILKGIETGIEFIVAKFIHRDGLAMLAPSDHIEIVAFPFGCQLVPYYKSKMDPQDRAREEQQEKRICEVEQDDNLGTY
jgi:hypothetical protein